VREKLPLQVASPVPSENTFLKAQIESRMEYIPCYRSSKAIERSRIG